MRRVLDLLYDPSAALAAVLMVALLLAVLASMLDRVITLPIRGLDAYAGYFMAGAGFLALAHTLRRGEHIRVSLVLQAVGPGLRRVLGLFSLGVAVLLSGLLAWYSVRLSWQSWVFHDISTSFDATPLWIPQMAMAFGCFVLLIAFIDESWAAWRGAPVLRVSDEVLHSE